METARLGTASNFKKKQTVIKENCANWWSMGEILFLKLNSKCYKEM